jgi:hypothetical protein
MFLCWKDEGGDASGAFVNHGPMFEYDDCGLGSVLTLKSAISRQSWLRTSDRSRRYEQARANICSNSYKPVPNLISTEVPNHACIPAEKGQPRLEACRYPSDRAKRRRLADGSTSASYSNTGSFAC